MIQKRSTLAPMCRKAESTTTHRPIAAGVTWISSRNTTVIDRLQRGGLRSLRFGPISWALRGFTRSNERCELTLARLKFWYKYASLKISPFHSLRSSTFKNVSFYGTYKRYLQYINSDQNCLVINQIDPQIALLNSFSGHYFRNHFIQWLNFLRYSCFRSD